MIGYRNSNLKELITQLLIRAKQHRVAENIDYETCRIFINRAIRDVVSKTWSFKRWAYINRISVADGVALPQDYIQTVRVILHNGDNDYKDARKADVKEFWTVTDVNRGNLWNVSSNMNPVFMIWGMVDLNAYTTPTPPDTRILIRPINYTGFMDCIMYPAPLVNDTDVCLIPYDYEELVIYYALIRLLYKLNNLTVLSMIEPILQNELSKIQFAAAAETATTQRELDSFVEPLSPFIPAPQPEGELPQVLK